jgi:hypothetical protein
MDNLDLVSYEVIGQKLGLSISVVHETYKRGMKKIRRILAKNPKLAEELFDYLYPRKEIGPRGVSASRSYLARVFNSENG